jgi:hypothetical protein
MYKLPMAVARDLLQRSLGRYLDFLEARRSYSDAVASYMGASGLSRCPAGRW